MKAVSFQAARKALKAGKLVALDITDLQGIKMRHRVLTIRTYRYSEILHVEVEAGWYTGVSPKIKFQVES